MRAAQRRQTRSQTARTLSVSAPVGGINAREPISQQKPQDALTLDNFFCTPYDVMLRHGYASWATGISGTVDTIAAYSPPTGSSKLFASAGTSIYDVTNAGTVGAAVISGNATGSWQYVNFGTAGGNYMVMTNGSDLPLVYNGSGWDNLFPALLEDPSGFPITGASITSVGTTATVTTTAAHNLKTGMSVVIAGFTPSGYNGTYIVTVTGPSTFTYTLSGALGVVTVVGTVTPLIDFGVIGVDPTTLIGVTVFKSRLFYVQKDTLSAWYMPTLSIGGTASQLDFSSIFSLGGYLMAIGTWSLDAGYGMDDYCVFITSKGEVAVYRGTDPASDSTWALVGIYIIGSPIGRRCFTKFAGDLLVICKDGLAPLSKALMSSRVSTKSNLTDKIQHIVSEYTTLYSGNSGWETTIFPPENMLLLNVPIGSGKAYQLVMNTISGSWSRFVGWNASCMELYEDNLYFGGNGAVYRAWYGYTDDGAAIYFDAQQSFSTFGVRTQQKKVEMVRPIVSLDGPCNVLVGVNTDYDISTTPQTPTFTASTNAIWDSSVWDGATTWGGDLQTQTDWQTCFGVGFAVAAHIQGASLGTRLHWASTDYLVSGGGVL